MSERTREFPRRSVQMVPGSSERFLEKAQSLGADQFIFDLEDAVAPSKKAMARLTIASALTTGNWGNSIRAVRVNSWDTPWTREDVTTVVSRAGNFLDAIVLPKVSSPSDVEALDQLLTQLESDLDRPQGIGIEVMIESASGLVRSEEIARSSQRLESLIFGPIDFAASIGMTNLDVLRRPTPAEQIALVAVRMRLLVAARSAGIAAIDGPFVHLEDENGLRQSAHDAASLGYDGKWSIHPSQIDILNVAFSPSQEVFDRAHVLLDRYLEAESEQGQGAARFDGEMIDEATRQLVLAVVRRGELAQLTRTVAAAKALHEH